MPSFSQLKSTKQLRALALHPFDLSKEEALTPKRIETMILKTADLKLCYAAQRVDDQTIQALLDLAQETKALEKMEQMQSGEIVNFIQGFESENRPALHTAMRDLFDSKQVAKPAAAAAKLAEEEIRKLKTFLNEIEKQNKFTDLVQIGIGGSDLGPRAVYLALQAYQTQGRRIHFLSNVDPDDAAHIFKEIDFSKTLVVIVSKSGTTIETRTNEEFFKEAFKKRGLNPKDHLIAVTGKGSPMDDPSQYLASFYMWDYVGGRYSATSMVGGVMLAFALGIEKFLEFLKGAHVMDQIALKQDPRANLPLYAALLGIWNRNFLNLPTCAVIPYSQGLSRFSAHLQQLDMESNGKSIDKEGSFVDFETGPIIWGEPGTNGQHSFYQSIHQGTGIVPLEMIGFQESQYREDLNYSGTSSQEKLLANLFAQSIALAKGQKSKNPNKTFKGNRPNSVLLARRLDPYTMGLLLSYYEHKVAFQGFIWNINSFDQEGVQLGKVLAQKITEQFEEKRKSKSLDVSAFPEGEAYLTHALFQ